MRRFVYNPRGRVNFSMYMCNVGIIRRKRRRIFRYRKTQARRQTVINGKQTASRKSPELRLFLSQLETREKRRDEEGRGSLYLRSRTGWQNSTCQRFGSEIQSWLFYQSARGSRRINRSRCFPTLFFHPFCFSAGKNCVYKAIRRCRVLFAM